MNLKINKKQFQTKNFKGVVSLLAGNTASKLILTLGGIYLAKWYGPESYGVYSVFQSYLIILPVLAGLQLENIMMLQKGSKELRNLFSASILIIFILTFLMISVVAVLKAFHLFNFDIPYFLLILCGLGGILTGWNLTQNALFTKYKLFKQISTAFIIASLFSVAFQFLFYVLGFEENGLIYGWIIGLIASFIYNLRVSKNRWERIDFKSLKAQVKEHFNVIKYYYTSTAINTIANNILPLLVILYFGKLEVGVYMLAMKILSTPLVLLASSISKVYFQKSVTLFRHDRKGLLDLTFRVSGSSFLVILVFLVALNTIGISILELIFKGNEWVGLRHYTLVLSLWILARSALNPIAGILVVINRNQYSLIFNIYLLIVNLIAIYVGVLYNNFEYCLYLFTLFSSLGYIIQLIAIIIDLKKLTRSEI